MPSFDFFMPTKIYSGKGALLSSKAEFSGYTRAFIVTGKHSAKLCGAYDGLCALLDSLGIRHTLFDKIGENPKLSVCYEGGSAATEAGAELIIGVGGGSVLDAAKAIAAFVANPLLEKDMLFSGEVSTMLPLILVPTTSGTGSEVNNYSVLTVDELNVKRTFKSDLSYAKAAILDPTYTYTLDINYTVSTALDAFCHCIESYLSPKSTDISMMFALFGAKKLWNALKAIKKSPQLLLERDNIAVEALRADLMSAACAGGIAINTTGTGFPHPLGYSITLYSSIPHGKACALFIGEYIKYNMKNAAGASRLNTFASHLQTTPEEIAYVIPGLADVSLSLDADTRLSYIDKVRHAANFANSPYIIDYEEMIDIYSRLFI